MTKLKGLILTEGMHGMISQAEGLAKVLDLDFIHEKIELSTFWKLLPPKITPVENFVFKNKFDHDFNICLANQKRIGAWSWRCMDECLEFSCEDWFKESI